MPTGWSSRLLKQEFNRGGLMQRLLLRYTQALITQMTQTAACNRHHSVEQQLCRWLLLTLDRVPSRELVMTQELVASMLGVRREGITEAAGNLQRAGFIRYRRGHIAVLERSGLETARVRVLRRRQEGTGPPAVRRALPPERSRRRLSVCIGGVEGDRTLDLRIANATLSQLSYHPENRLQL